MRLKKREPSAITFGLFNVFSFGSDEDMIAGFGSLEKAEIAWHAVRDEFLERWDMWGRPAAWWRFEPGVPPDIRSGPHAIITEADAAEWARIDKARRAHLTSIGIDPTPPRSYRPFGYD